MSDRRESVQHAAFLQPAGGGELRLCCREDGERLRCASLLKPLVFWAAGHLEPLRRETARWEALARQAVTVSANDPTTEAWEASGSDDLLGWLRRRTGTDLPLEPGGKRAFGRVLVKASEVARAYAAMAAASASTDDELAGRLLGWMREVPARQTFGVRDVLVERLGAPPEQVAVKCGWFLDSDETRIRTHAVALAPDSAGFIGVAVLTALPADESIRRYYAVYDTGEEVTSLHEGLVGSTIRTYANQALEELLGS